MCARGLALLLVVVTLASCSKSSDKPGGKVAWVDPNTIQPGPIRHEKLSEEQMERIRTLQATFVEVDGHPLDKWVDDFKRDQDPDKEIRIWERMAKAYRSYCDKHELSAEAKKDVYSVVLMRSMASEQDVLERVKLKKLTKEEAKEVMRGF
jgi:hypothetical protein